MGTLKPLSLNGNEAKVGASNPEPQKNIANCLSNRAGLTVQEGEPIYSALDLRLRDDECWELDPDSDKM